MSVEMSTDPPAVRSRASRVESIARLVVRIGQPASRNEAARRVCEAAIEELGSACAAVYFDDGVLGCAASSGFTLLPPDGVPASMDPEELEVLAHWAHGAGLGFVEMAPLRHEDQQLGLLALFGGRVEPFDAESLALLGLVMAHAIEQARVMDELRRAYDTLDRTREQAVRTERLRVLGEMALGIAHEFNNVLNAMLGQLGVLEMLAPDRLDLLQPIARIKEVALEGAATVSRLQDFSRQRRDREFSDVALSDLLRGVVAALRDGPCRATDVVERIDPGIVVAGAEHELRDVLVSVFTNAVEAGARQLRVTLTRQDEEARLSIMDDGAGMSRDVRKRAFDPFFTTKGSLGSGLGLSVAYGIVRRHGGRIDLESSPGRGCQVKIRLPAARVAELQDPPLALTAAAGGTRILLVEDDVDNREAMATLLGMKGYAVVAAESGSEAVRRFGESVFDLVLTDLGLPDMSGWDVARHVKDVKCTIPVALITGWGLSIAPDEARGRGVDLVIKKPIEPGRFLEQLTEMCAQPRTAA